MGHARAGGVKHQVKPLWARVNDQPESDIEPAFVPRAGLLQLSPRFQGRTSGAPSLTALAVNSADGREQPRR
jgi:hypothetical protein